MNYIIGIDLGTTNCVVAYQKEEESEEIQHLPIQQVMGDGSLGEKVLFPSFLYMPMAHETPALPWDKEQRYYLGTCARERGEELPGRVISSAKSWLSHTAVDRRAQHLPAGEEVEDKLSPLEVVTEYLKYLATIWNERNPDAPFDEQKIYITVPASFDPAARELTEEAALEAGYPEITLLEEPQAAFYAWLYRHQDEWRNILSVGDCVVVVDVGGGTTDFSLITVEEHEGDLVLERKAVGDHLLLGGDNMDLTLAYHLKMRLEEEGHDISETQLQSLTHSCRAAKEQLLAKEAPEAVTVTVLGEGSSLIGGSLSTKLTREEAHQILVEGFFPIVSKEEKPQHVAHGFQEVGLPYARDPRISAHLAHFLSLHGHEPTAVLFNGGTMKGDAFQERITSLLSTWSSSGEVSTLGGADLDYGVSKGAAYYGLAATGGAIRIKGGIGRSYFVGIEGSAPAVPGIPPALTALCVAPFGMEEGDSVEIDQNTFSLMLGQTVTFRFFSRTAPTLSDGSLIEPGMMLKRWKGELVELQSIKTVLDKDGVEGDIVCVTLRAVVTELGVLELWCLAANGAKWKLSFELRQEEQPSVATT